MKKHKVLIVYHYIALYREAVFDVLIKDNDVDFYIASDLESNNDIKLISETSPILGKKHIRLKNIWITKSVLWQRGLINQVVFGGYDGIIFLGDPYFLSTWVSLLLSRVLGIKSYVWTHGFLHRSHKTIELLKKNFYRLATGVLLYGNEAKSDLIIAGFPRNRLFVINNSLDYPKQKKIRDAQTDEDISKTRNSLFNQPDLLQLVFIGRLTIQKKLDMLLKAVKQLNSREQKVNLLLIGDGESRKHLEDFVEELGVQDNVNFYGSCHDEEKIASLLCSSDLCVAPGEIGLTAMHCLGYGVPVITHNNRFKQMPEYEAIIDGKTGFLFEYDSITSLIEKIYYFKDVSIANVRQKCIDIIEEFYTPDAQARLIKTSIGVIDEN